MKTILARNALKIFYDNAKTKLPVNSFDQLVEHYRTHYFGDGSGSIKHDEFLEEFGAAVDIARVDMATAMKNLARATPAGKLPKNEAFFKALSDQVLKLTPAEFASAVGKGLGKAATVATAGIGAGVGIYLAIAIGAILLPQLLAKAKLK